MRSCQYSTCHSTQHRGSAQFTGSCDSSHLPVRTTIIYCFSGIYVKMYISSQEGLHNGTNKQINRKISNREQVNYDGVGAGRDLAEDPGLDTANVLIMGLNEMLKWQLLGCIRSLSLDKVQGVPTKERGVRNMPFPLLGFAF